MTLLLKVTDLSGELTYIIPVVDQQLKGIFWPFRKSISVSIAKFSSDRLYINTAHHVEQSQLGTSNLNTSLCVSQEETEATVRRVAVSE